MQLGFVVVVTLLSSALVHAAGKCKVTKVKVVCDARCEKGSRPVDRVAVPPPGTLLPPVGIFTGVDEPAPPPSVPELPATPADGGLKHAAALLELEADVHSGLQAFMDCSDVEAHISPVALLSWAPVHEVSFGCVDGRTVEAGLGTWGADIGEFITALNVYEQMTSQRLSQTDVTNILRTFLSTSSRKAFATCMTSQTLRQMVGRQISTPNPSTLELAAAIRSPVEDKVAALWMKIVDPNFVGNDHVRFMLESPEEYSVRKELVQQAIHSFYDILWNAYDPLRDRLRVQVLGDGRPETAVAAVTVPDFCIKQAGLVPLISPATASASVALVNPDAVQVLRREIAFFFSRLTVPVVNADEMLKRVNVLAAGQAALTSMKVFDRVPVYSARIV